MKRVGFKRALGDGTGWGRQLVRLRVGVGWPLGKGLWCLRCLERGHYSPLPSLPSLFPLWSLLLSALRLPLGEPYVNSGTEALLEAGDSSLLVLLESKVFRVKRHRVDTTLITTHRPLKRKPGLVTPTLATFQSLPLALGIILKSLRCSTKATHALTPASLPSFMSSETQMSGLREASLDHPV